MIDYTTVILAYVVLAVGSKLVLLLGSNIVTRFALMVFNVLAVYIVFFVGSTPDGLIAGMTSVDAFRPFMTLFVLVVLFYFPIRFLGPKRSSLYLIPFLLPMLYLAFAKYTSIWNFIGISYISFRVALLTFQINSGEVKSINLVDYIYFTLFFASFLVGPITRYSDFDKTLVRREEYKTPFGEISLRFMVGILKFTLLAQIANQFSFTGLMLDGHLHYPIEYLVCSIGFLLYVYFNFSGLTDLSVASSALYGVRVKENFERPFIQTNIQGFWDHWHMSLSHFVRDCIYNPLAFYFARNWRFLPLRLSTLISVVIAFAIIGIWHGIEWRFLYYGLANAAGIIIFNFWKETKIPIPKILSVIITIIFVALCASLVEIPQDKYGLIWNKIIFIE